MMHTEIPPRKMSPMTGFLAAAIALIFLMFGVIVWMACALRLVERPSVREAEILVEDLEAEKRDSTQVTDEGELRDLAGMQTLEDLMKQNVFSSRAFVQIDESTVTDSATYLSGVLHAWLQVNENYCYPLRNYIEDGKVRESRAHVTPDEVLGDLGAQAALLNFFSVKIADKDAFFKDLKSYVKEEDSIQEMCLGSGGRRFLTTLDYVTKPGDHYLVSYNRPEVLEWLDSSPSAHRFIGYDIPDEEVTGDWLPLVTDWRGNVVLMTGYGDAGVSWWKYYLLERSGEQATATLMEDCTSALQTENETNVLKCNLEYQP